MVNEASKEKKPKYIKISWNGWDTIASLIDSEKELEKWLEDGSFEEGDIFFEVKRRFKVTTFKKEKKVYEEF